MHVIFPYGYAYKYTIPFIILRNSVLDVILFHFRNAQIQNNKCGKNRILKYQIIVAVII